MTPIHRLILFIVLELQLPMLSHLERFAWIDRGTAADVVSFNRAYRNHIERIQNLYPTCELTSLVIQETDRCYQAWDALRDAQCTSYSEITRRRALFTLRGLIGAEAFERGEMVANVPEHRLVWVRWEGVGR